MNHVRVLFAAGLSLAFAVGLLAQSNSKEKSPADLAAEAFYALRDDKEAPIDAARAAKVVAEGTKFLAENPRHGRVSSIINSLATYGTRLRDKKQAAVREYWLQQLKFEIVNRRTARDVTDDQQAVWGALEVAVAGYEARAGMSRDTARAMREKIDTLAQMPKGARFLQGAERDFLTLLVEMRALGAAETQARKLLDHKDAKIAAMAADELKLIMLRKQPLELKFTALDGRAVDVAALRGKLVLMLFFSAKTEKFDKEAAAVRDFAATQKDLELIAVCLDPVTDRAAVEAFMKAGKLKWTVLHDDAVGPQVAEQFAVKAGPAGFLLDRNGLLAVPLARLSRLEGEVKRLSSVK